MSRYNATSSGLTQAEADLRYLELTGGALTDDVTISSGKTIDGVDISTIPTSYLPLAGGTLTGDVTVDAGHTIDGVDISTIPNIAGVFTDVETFTKGGNVYASAGIPNAALNLITWIAPFSCTVTAVKGYRVGGTGATVNARLNGASNHMASALSLSSENTWMDGGAVQNTAYAAGDKLELMVVSTAGTVTQLGIQVNFTRP